MKKVLWLVLILVVLFVSCVPTASNLVNSATCDAELTFTEDGVQFDPVYDYVEDMFITLQGESLLTDEPNNEMYKQLVDTPVTFEIQQGEQVSALVTYERSYIRVKPYACFAVK